MSDMSTLSRKRPIGINIIAVFLAFSGLLALTGAMLNFVSVSREFGRMPNHTAAFLLTLGVISSFLSIYSFALVYGLWTLKRWAFWSTLALEVILLIQNIVLWLMHVYTPVAFILNSLAPLLIMGYLFFNQEVRATFNTSHIKFQWLK